MQRTILFIDLDATVQTNPFSSAVFPRISACLSAATNLSPKIHLGEIIAENCRRLAEIPPSPALAMDWDDVVKTVASRYGVAFVPSVELLVRDNSGPPHSCCLDNAPTVLASLSANGTRKIVAASMGLSKYQFPVLHSLGLFDLFDDFLMPDLVGHLKTEPDFYQKYTSDRNGKLFISIGDKYSDDIVPPKAFGFRAVLKAPIPELQSIAAFDRPMMLDSFRQRITGRPALLPVLPDAVITSLYELENVVSIFEESF